MRRGARADASAPGRFAAFQPELLLLGLLVRLVLLALPLPLPLLPFLGILLQKRLGERWALEAHAFALSAHPAFDAHALAIRVYAIPAPALCSARSHDVVIVLENHDAWRDSVQEKLVSLAEAQKQILELLDEKRTRSQEVRA